MRPCASRRLAREEAIPSIDFVARETESLSPPNFLTTVRSFDGSRGLTGRLDSASKAQSSNARLLLGLAATRAIGKAAIAAVRTHQHAGRERFAQAPALIVRGVVVDQCARIHAHAAAEFDHQPGVAKSGNATIELSARRRVAIVRSHLPGRARKQVSDRSLAPLTSDNQPGFGHRVALDVTDHFARSIRTRSEFSRKRSNTIRLPSGVMSNVRIAALSLRRVSCLHLFVARSSSQKSCDGRNPCM